jgi:hypothetical protein
MMVVVVVIWSVMVAELTAEEGRHQVLVEGLVGRLVDVDVVVDEGLLQISLVSVARGCVVVVVVVVTVVAVVAVVMGGIGLRVGRGGLLLLSGHVMVVVMGLGVELAGDRVAGEVVGVEGCGGAWGGVGTLVVAKGGASTAAEAEVAVDGDGSEGVICRDLNLDLGVV